MADHADRFDAAAAAVRKLAVRVDARPQNRAQSDLVMAAEAELAEALRALSAPPEASEEPRGGSGGREVVRPESGGFESSAPPEEATAPGKATSSYTLTPEEVSRALRRHNGPQPRRAIAAYHALVTGQPLPPSHWDDPWWLDNQAPSPEGQDEEVAAALNGEADGDLQQEAEPVAWRWRVDGCDDEWRYGDQPPVPRRDHDGALDFEFADGPFPLPAAPPAELREAAEIVARALVAPGFPDYLLVHVSDVRRLRAALDAAPADTSALTTLRSAGACLVEAGGNLVAGTESTREEWESAVARWLDASGGESVAAPAVETQCEVCGHRNGGEVSEIERAYMLVTGLYDHPVLLRKLRHHFLRGECPCDQCAPNRGEGLPAAPPVETTPCGAELDPGGLTCDLPRGHQHHRNDATGMRWTFQPAVPAPPAMSEEVRELRAAAEPFRLATGPNGHRLDEACAALDRTGEVKHG